MHPRIIPDISWWAFFAILGMSDSHYNSATRGDGSSADAENYGDDDDDDDDEERRRIE